MRTTRILLGVISGFCAGPMLLAQDDLRERVSALERENQELSRRLDLLAESQERFELGDLVRPIGESEWGLGPAASKVYGVESGLSIGGYGEAVYRAMSGSADNEFDLLRAVLYFGYRFSERWVFNSEIEFEHAGEETGVEFAYLDYLASDCASGRAGLLLVPMGFLNELHEPTTFLGAARPETERRILPTTWRENGAGVFGEAGGLSYRAYVVNGFDATGFSDEGLRGGRQNGSEALAEDLAVVARVDWTDTPGLLVGGSAYQGDAGQEQAGLGDTSTSILEAHADWRWRALRTRALFARAEVDDVAQLDAALGLGPLDSVGEEMEGFYVEAGYDLAGLFTEESEISITPFVRYEDVDTQAEVPSGFMPDPAQDFDVVTLGVDVKPIDQIVFKIDVQDFDRGPDSFNVALGYAF